jgi:hypothetical protein
LEISKLEIEKLIEIRKKDTFFNHFLAILKHDLRPTGIVSKSQIKIWKYNSWLGLFYPVFMFQLNSNNQSTKINSKLNSVGKLVYALLFISISSLFTNVDLIKIKFDSLLFLIIFYMIFISVFVLISVKVYSYEKKRTIKNYV